MQRDDRGDQDDLQVVQVGQAGRSSPLDLGAISVEHADRMVGVTRNHASSWGVDSVRGQCLKTGLPAERPTAALAMS